MISFIANEARDYSSSCRPFAIMGLLLAGCAITGHLRYDDDSLQHFNMSVGYIRRADFLGLFSDMWNKPIPGLLYGTTGLFGLYAARLAGVFMVVCTAYMTHRVACYLMPGVVISPWVSVAAFFFQMPVLSQATLTMTELPAAFFIGLGLLTYYCLSRPYLGAFWLGCSILNRLELAASVGPALAGLAFLSYRSAPAANLSPPWLSPLGRAVAVMMAGALPPVVWVAGISIFEGSLDWLRSGNYASVRDLDIQGLLRTNVMTHIASALSPLAVLLVATGAAMPPGRVESRRRQQWLPIYLLTAVHLAVLNTLAVYPPDWSSDLKGHAIAAINDRNFITIAPAFAILICAGVYGFAAPSDTKQLQRRWLIAMVGATTLAVFFLAAHALPFSVPRKLTWMQVALLGISVCELCVLTRLYGLRRLQGTSIAKILAWSLVISCLVLNPLFWYPTRWNDRRTVALEALGAAIAERQAEPPLVIQDISSALGDHVALGATPMHWSWRTTWLEQLQQAKSGTLVVLKSVDGETPARYYPADVVEELSDASRYKFIGSFRPSASSAWDRWFAAFQGRNPPIGWLLYEVAH
jgi:hypothetical protein